MSVVTLRWEDRSTSELGQRIYRSESPIDTENLPSPLAILAPNVEEYRDESVEEGETYHYLVSSYNDKVEKFSNAFEVTTVNGAGPGPQELIQGNEEVGFFGETLASELITGSDLTALVQGPTAMPGTHIAMWNEEPWLKFILDGKILYVHKKGIRHSISWDHLNTLDLVYGNRSIEINGYQYRIRLLTGADVSPTPVSSNGYYLDGTHNSEWSRLFYPLVRDDVNVPTRDPEAPYTNADLGMTWVNEATTPGSYSWCQETHQDDAAYRVLRGQNGVSYLIRGIRWYGYPYYGWRPCLELVP